MVTETTGDCSPHGRPGDELMEANTTMAETGLSNSARTLGDDPNLRANPNSIENSSVSKGVQDVTMTDESQSSTTTTATNPNTCDAGTQVFPGRAADDCMAPIDSSTTSCIKAAEAECELVVVSKQDVSIGKKGSGSSTSTSRTSGKVIVTDVTINSLTVTFKEALTAEGFFKGCGMKR